MITISCTWQIYALSERLLVLCVITARFHDITRSTFYGTRYLSHCYAYFAFNPLFVNWVTSLTPRVTWCHRSRDHWKRRWSFPIGGLLMPSHYLARLPRYWASNISGSWPWPFRVTWRHRSRDHWNRRWSFPIGHLLTPCPYLPPLQRY